jgi:cytochrome c oxidase subunit 4
LTEHATATEPTHPPQEAVHHGHTPEEIRKEMRVYLWVLGGLAALTALTVYACYGLKMPVHTAILIALVIACSKGFLVAGFFMHLLSERKIIYGVLLLTVFFFAVLLWGPWHHNYDMFGR